MLEKFLNRYKNYKRAMDAEATGLSEDQIIKLTDKQINDLKKLVKKQKNADKQYFSSLKKVSKVEDKLWENIPAGHDGRMIKGGMTLEGLKKLPLSTKTSKLFTKLEQLQKIKDSHLESKQKIEQDLAQVRESILIDSENKSKTAAYSETPNIPVVVIQEEEKIKARQAQNKANLEARKERQQQQYIAEQSPETKVIKETAQAALETQKSPAKPQPLENSHIDTNQIEKLGQQLKSSGVKTGEQQPTSMKARAKQFFKKLIRRSER